MAAPDELTELLKIKSADGKPVRSRSSLTRYRKGPPPKWSALLATDVGRELVREWLERAEQEADGKRTAA